MDKKPLEATPMWTFAFPGGINLEARKSVVSKNEVFERMLSSNMVEAETGIVNIKDCDPNAFKIFLNYLETGRIGKANEKETIHLLEIADKYLDDNLKVICEKNLCRLLDRFNALEFFAKSIDRNYEILKVGACIFVRNDLDYFLGIPQFDSICRNEKAVKMLFMNPINYLSSSFKYFEPISGMRAVTRGSCSFELSKADVFDRFDSSIKKKLLNCSEHFLTNDLAWIAILIIDKVQEDSPNRQGSVVASTNQYELVLTLFSQISHIVSCSADIEIILRSARKPVESLHKILRGVSICKRKVLLDEYERYYTKIHDLRNQIRSEPTSIITYNDLYGIGHSLMKPEDTHFNVDIKFTFNSIVRK